MRKTGKKLAEHPLTWRDLKRAIAGMRPSTLDKPVMFDCGDEGIVCSVYGPGKDRHDDPILLDATAADYEDTEASRLPNGVRVKTRIVPNRVAKDWDLRAPAVVYRRSGATGRVVAVHDSHGLYYDVEHEDGIVGCYEPHELFVLKGR